MSAELRSARALPPGRIIRRELEARGWSQKYLAEILGRPESKISPIIAGKKQITPEMAIALSEAFGTSAELWINLESNYRLRLAEDATERGTVARRLRLRQYLPIAELVKRGWLPDTQDQDELESAVCDLLGVSNLGAVPRLAASFRGANRATASIPALVAWCQHARSLAAGLTVSKFSATRFRSGCIDEVLSLTAGLDGVPRVREVLGSYGVRFVVLRHLPQTYLDGVVLYLNRQPVVGLTLRYDRVDSFWFSLMHELGHIYAGHVGEFLDELDPESASSDPEEEESNRLAAEWLVPGQPLARFAQAVRPYYSRAHVESFAASIARHPGIVAGRLHRMGEIPHKNLRPLLERVSPQLGAVVAE